MEPLSVRILRNIGLRPYGTVPQDPNVFKPGWLAERLGVDLKTVKAHLRTMEKTGFIRFYQVYPNFHHLGIEASAWLFRSSDEDRKAELIKGIEPIEGLVEVHNFIGPQLCVDLSYRSTNDLAEKLLRLQQLTSDASPLRFYDRHMPKVGRQLSKLDWQVLKALRYQARRPLKEAAQEVGVNLRTFRRRFERMAQEGSLFIVPALDPSKASGLILFELLVYTNPDANASTIQRILKIMDEHYVYHYVPSSPGLGNFDILGFAETTGEVEELRLQGRYVPGVAKVEALVFSGWNEYTQWLDVAMDRAIEQSSA